MVKETRVIFDLAELKAVRLQCGHCSVEVVYKNLEFSMPSDCPLCGEAWDTASGLNKALARAIRSVMRADELPMTIRFEIDGETG